jgi:hypothetical protein
MPNGEQTQHIFISCIYHKVILTLLDFLNTEDNKIRGTDFKFQIQFCISTNIKNHVHKK